MNVERIKEIQKETAYPDSISVQQALFKVWNECEQEQQLKNCNLQSVSNWGEMKLACKYSKKHDKFTACLHKDTDPAMICFDPAHCPMIKKWSNCAFNRPDC